MTLIFTPVAETTAHVFAPSYIQATDTNEEIPTDGDKKYVVKGVVTDDQNQPLIGVVVTLNQNRITKAGAATNEDGTFSIYPHDTGTYELKIVYQSYLTVLKTLEVTENPIDLDIKMEIDTIIHEMPLVIGYVVPLLDVPRIVEENDANPKRTTDKPKKKNKR